MQNILHEETNPSSLPIREVFTAITEITMSINLSYSRVYTDYYYNFDVISRCN